MSGPARLGRRLSLLLVAVTVPTSAATAFWPGLLHGPAVMNGSARGTALVMLLGASPTVLLGLRSAHVSARALACWTGGLAYLTYNGVMLCFATPFNALFPAYVAVLGLAGWSLAAVLRHLLAEQVPGPERMPAAGTYLVVVAALNALAWLGQIVPALGDRSPGFLAGTGLATNPVHVQDLALWLPAMIVAGVLLRTGRPHARLLGGAGLVFWQLEALGVAVDQTLGQHADPGSSVATYGGAWLFAALFVVGAVPTAAVLRRLPGRLPGDLPGRLTGDLPGRPEGHRSSRPGPQDPAAAGVARVGWSRRPDLPAGTQEGTS